MVYQSVRPAYDEHGNPIYHPLCEAGNTIQDITDEVRFRIPKNDRRDTLKRLLECNAVALSLCCDEEYAKPLPDVGFSPWFDFLLSDRAYKILKPALEMCGDFYLFDIENMPDKHCFAFKCWEWASMENPRGLPAFKMQVSPYGFLVREDVVQKMVETQLTGFVSMPVSAGKSG